MQAIKELILSSKDLQRDIVESGRVSNYAVFNPGHHALLDSTDLNTISSPELFYLL